MQSETIEIRESNSRQLEASGLILSVRETYGGSCAVVIGYPGLPNAVKKMETGDSVLFETPHAGVFEVRVLSQNLVLAQFLVTHISPKPGIAGVFVAANPGNAPFTENELNKIDVSIEKVKEKLGDQSYLLPHQLDLLERKLDEIQDSSRRLGRKDWINYVTGALTSLFVSAAFSDEARKFVYVSFDAAFSWLFESAAKLIS